jgi:hypothetical protein
VSLAVVLGRTRAQGPFCWYRNKFMFERNLAQKKPAVLLPVSF